MKTNWQMILDRYQRHIHHKRYGPTSQKMVGLVENLSDMYADTNLKVSSSLLTLTISMPSAARSLDIIWHDEEQAYHVYWIDKEPTDQVRLVAENEILEVVAQYIDSYSQT